MRPDTRAWLDGRRARGYLRVSTKRQADTYGPAAQRHDEEQAAGSYGTATVSLFYEDHVTGTNALVRSDFQRMVSDARARQFDVLLVARVDRFARNERDSWNYLHALTEAGVAVYFCEEDVLVPHDEGWQDRIGESINSAAAYSRRLSRNVRKGLERKWASGGHIGPVPWGYRRTTDKRLIEPDPETAPQRALCFDLYATGRHTYATLATELNGRGVRILSRGVLRPFTKFTVKDVLDNPVVIGTIGQRERRQGAVEPIVTIETWRRVREIVARRYGAAEKPVQRRHRYVFASVARCAECGERFWGRLSHQRNQRPYRQLYHAPRGCRRGSRNEERLTTQIGAWLATWSLPADGRVRIAQYLNAPHPTDAGKAIRRKQIEAEHERLRNLYRWGDIAEDDYLGERRRLARALDELGPDAPVKEPSEDALRLAATIGHAWGMVTDETRREFIEEWIAELRIRKDGGLDILPREPYREIVYASQMGSVGCAGLYGNGADLPTVRVVGLEEWQEFWERTG